MSADSKKPIILVALENELPRNILPDEHIEYTGVGKINAAIKRIEDGSYGYCDETGDPINIKRLEARPVATLSLEAQESHEKKERIKIKN